jgi:hypothetical protein
VQLCEWLIPSISSMQTHSSKPNGSLCCQRDYDEACLFTRHSVYRYNLFFLLVSISKSKCNKPKLSLFRYYLTKCDAMYFQICTCPSLSTKTKHCECSTNIHFQMTGIIIPVEYSSVLGHEDLTSFSKRRLSSRTTHT